MGISLYRTAAVDFCIAIIAGVLIGRWEELFALSFLLSTLTVLFLIASSQMPRRYRPLIPVFLILGFLSIDRAERVFDAENHIRNFAPASKVKLEGAVKTPIRFFPDGYRFTLDVRRLVTKDGKERRVTGLVAVNVYTGKKPPLPGDMLEIIGVRIKPIIGSRNFGGFDYERFMKDKGIGVRAAASEKKIRLLQKGSLINPRRVGEVVRRRVKSYIDRNFPPNIAPIAASMTIGVTGGIDSDTRRRFAVSGIAHLLAISGLHVGFISGLFYLILNALLFYFFWFFRRSYAESGFHRKPAAIVADIVIILFVLSTGMRVSALRAGIMVGIYFMAVLLKREKDVLNALAVSAIIILLIDPAALFTASFILSYLAVLSIIFFVAYESMQEDIDKDLFEKLEAKTPLKRLRDFALGTVKITVTIVVMGAPALMSIFHEVHFGGFMANILALPMAAIAVPSTLFGAMMDALSPTLGTIAAWPAIITLSGIDAVAAFFSKINFLSFSGPAPSFVLILFYYATLIVIFNWRRLGKRIAWGFACLAVISITAFYWPYARTATEVHFIDVGQGESALVMLKDGKNVLIDGGPDWGRGDAGDYVILPALRRLGVRRLDAVIATHGDADHVGGIATILKRMKVKRFFDNGQAEQNFALEEVRKIAMEKGIPYSVLRAGMNVFTETAKTGDAESFKVVHPSGKFAQSHPDASVNDASLAIILEVEGLKILFASDMEKEAEKYLLEENADVKADVLKVAHHGSRTSSAARFLNAVGPSAAIINAGRLNRWRHPSKTVLRRLEKRGITILSTMNDGEIVLTLKGGKMEAKTFMNPRAKPIKTTQ